MQFKRTTKLLTMIEIQSILTQISLASLFGTYANSADPDQTPQDAASDQGLHCLLTENYNKNKIKIENTPDISKFGNGLIQMIRMDKSIRQIWVKTHPGF